MNITRKDMGFIGAILLMIIIYSASSAPIPLYSSYKLILGLTKANLSMSAVTYFLGTVISLLFLGRISDYIGRRKAILLTVLIAIIGCLSFLYVNSYIVFLIARLMQGLSCGLASSCVGAYIVDTTPGENSKISAIFTSGCTMIGLSLGCFSSAVVSQLNPANVYLTYLTLILLMIIISILILLGEETVKYKSGVLSSIKAYVEIPQSVKSFIIPASAVYIGTWALGGFYQAYSSTIAVEQFGINNAILAALIFASLMAPQILGNTLIRRMDDIKAQRYGMILFTIVIMFILYTLMTKQVILFVILSVIAAILIGVVVAASMDTLLSRITSTQRAGILSTIYLISYGGTAVINFVVGAVGDYFSLISICTGYVILTVIATIIVLFTSKNNIST